CATGPPPPCSDCCPVGTGGSGGNIAGGAHLALQNIAPAKKGKPQPCPPQPCNGKTNSKECHVPCDAEKQKCDMENQRRQKQYQIKRVKKYADCKVKELNSNPEDPKVKKCWDEYEHIPKPT